MTTSTLQARRAPTWQFSIRKLILAVAFVAFVLSWLRWFWTENEFAAYYPGFYGLCSVVVLLIACFQLRRASGCSSAWNLVAVAWFIAIGNLFCGILQAFSVVSADNLGALAQLLQEGVYIAIVSAITLPLFFTVPVLYLLVVRYRSHPQSITCWLYGSLAMAAADTVLFVILVSITFGTWGR